MDVSIGKENMFCRRTYVGPAKISSDVHIKSSFINKNAISVPIHVFVTLPFQNF